MNRPRLSIRNSILMTVCIILSIPGFILYEIFKTRYLNWRDLKLLRFFLQMYYNVIGRIMNIMVKDI